MKASGQGCKRMGGLSGVDMKEYKSDVSNMSDSICFFVFFVFQNVIVVLFVLIEPHTDHAEFENVNDCSQVIKPIIS